MKDGLLVIVSIRSYFTKEYINDKLAEMLNDKDSPLNVPPMGNFTNYGLSLYNYGYDTFII